MLNFLKIKIRDLLPKKHQVPIKYWYSWIGGKLEPEMKLLESIVLRSDKVIDVGGNRGVYAYQLWKLAASVEVFEPNPLCSDVLKAWAEDKPSVRINSVALSSRSGYADLHIPIDKSGTEHDSSASIENTYAHVRDQTVQVKTLDSYRFEGVSLIKIDVEGHEYSVIEGAKATLLSSKPALLIEIEQRHINRPINEVFDKILSLGYQGYFVGLYGLNSLDKFSVSLHQSMEKFSVNNRNYINNFLFLHKERIHNNEYELFLNASSQEIN
jgi:FkbM family methyltransferase